MKYLIFSLLFWLVLLLLAGGLTISFHPEFHIALPRWRVSLGALLFLFAFFLLDAQAHLDGMREGIKKSVNCYEGVIDQLIDDGKVDPKDVSEALDKQIEKIKKVKFNNGKEVCSF